MKKPTYYKSLLPKPASRGFTTSEVEKKEAKPIVEETQEADNGSVSN